MDINDIYYRALSEYRNVTAKERRLEKRRKAIAAAGGDRIEIVTVNCIIEEDWIEAIEKGLVHVETCPRIPWSTLQNTAIFLQKRPKGKI